VERVEIMLAQFTDEKLYSQEACLAYIGALFKVKGEPVEDWGWVVDWSYREKAGSCGRC
jgi:hypothetical protein